MKIVKINGGLGNQFFQYAFAFALQKRNEDNVLLDFPFKLDDSSRDIELDKYNIELREASKKEVFNCIFSRDKTTRKITVNTMIEEIEFGVFHPEQFEVVGDRCIFGHFQSEKYFAGYRDEILNNFTLKISLDTPNQNLLDEIKNTNSVSLHIRRGDYLNLSDIYCTCSIEYYKNAIKYISEKTGKIKLFVFSDDIMWARENLKTDFETVFVDFNNDKPYYDMELMRNCRHNIIANSTFSWWGAWLNENKNKIVIALQKWFNNELRDDDIVPADWIKMKNQEKF